MGTSPAGGGTAGRPAARPRRRGGGPEESSATATIVAVTTSDSAGTSTKAGEFKTKLKINHWRSSPGPAGPGPPELAGFYVDSVWVSVSDNSLEGIKNRQAFAFIIK